ncbi:MAG: hypothetical protein J6K74_06710 [Marinifilaceae bacterium]|nr:hypothetical protein [Marinifilaceae bacterium]
METKVSIEIGSRTTVVACASVNSNGEVRINDVEMAPTIGYSDGKIVSEELLADLLASLVKRVSHGLCDDGFEIQFVLPWRHLERREHIVKWNKRVKSIDSDLLSKLAAECKKEVLLGNGYELIDMIPSGLNVDGEEQNFLYSIQDSSQIELKWAVYIAKNSILDRWAKIFENLGADSVSFVPAERAYAKAFGGLTVKMPEYAVVDLGALSESLFYYRGGMLVYSAFFKVGANSIDSDIATAYDIPQNVATQLKHQSGEALLYACKESHVPMPDGINDCKTHGLMTVIQCRMEELYEGVIYQLQQKGCEQGVEAILVGGGNNLKNSDLLFKLLSRMEVPHLAYDGIEARLDSVLGVKEFALAIGAAGAETEDGELKSSGGFWSIFSRRK